jgi:hypothetical protein
VTEPDPSSRRRWPATLAFATAAALLLIAAARVMFSAFMFYDDEGYVLLSLRNFAEHGGLYREVYSQYGPFPFVFHYLLHLLGLPLTHTVGRAITLCAWGGAAVLCAWLAGRATRSLIARLVVLAGVFAYLWVMASEPTHPGGLIILLTTVAAVLGHHWLERERLRAWALLVGGVTAALLLTKINIGGFAGCAACAWLLLHHRSAKVQRWAPGLLLVGSALLPLALMRPLLGTEWVQSFALVWGCAALAVVRTLGINAEGRTGWASLGWGLLGATVVGGVVLGVTVARGSSLADIWGGVVLGPLRQPTTFSIRYLWTPGIRLVALASLALCVWAVAARSRRRPAVETAVALGRLAAAAALAFNLTRFPEISADYLVFGWVMPCLWLFAWPLAGEDPRTTHARAWVVLMLLGQCLHVFPVAGSQIAWGTLLTLPLAAIGAWDAAVWLGRRHAARLTAPRARAIALTSAVAMLALAGSTGWKFTEVGQRYREGEYLNLPGAELLRLPEGSSALFRLLSLNAIAHADVLFSEPGMFSFNIWSGLPTPTGANVTHWFSLLDPTKQQAIQRQLEQHPRACVIVHREHVDFLAKRGLAPAGPLHDFIAREFTPVFKLDDFEFCVRRGRTITPFLVADLLSRASDAAPAPAGENALLRFAVLLPTAAPVARLEVTTMPGAPAPFHLDASNTRVELTPLNARGLPVGPARPAAWPLTLTGPCALSFYFDHARLPRPEKHATLTLRDAAGREIGLARLQ